MTKFRLNYFLSNILNFCSRREASRIVKEEEIRVNGETVQDDWYMVSEEDRITLNGKPLLVKKNKKILIALNKPIGFICSNKRLRSCHKLVIDLIPKQFGRVFTIGRLDKDTSGLIFLTNDGDLANYIMHPSNQIKKIYLVQLRDKVSKDDLFRLRIGVRIKGDFVKPLFVERVKSNLLKICIIDGKKHEIRIMILKIGLKVVELKRIRIGKIGLGFLTPGEFKVLDDANF